MPALSVMVQLARFLPLRDLLGTGRPRLGPDLLAGLTVTFLSIPQGVAYALIADLPPAMGLYAATLPAVVGSLMRSSRLVVAGPTNALSLLVGGSVAILARDLGLAPAEIAVTLALAVGIFQVAAGALRLGTLVDFISMPVVLGYVTGAGVLIGVGQLHHLSGSAGGTGDALSRLAAWLSGLGSLHVPTLALGLGTAALVIALRRLTPRLPSEMIALATGVGLSFAFDLGDAGVRLLADIAPIPAALPPLSTPVWHALPAVLTVAAAATVLSLIESTAVARSLSARSGQQLDTSVEFVGQGLANLSAAFCSGYPVSGSLARSALNHRAGATSRLSGALSGVLVLGLVLVAGPLLDATPVASLAGLLLVVAWNLIDRARVALVVRSSSGDALAFLGTLVGTWVLRLDHAIYLGIAISVASFLRRSGWLRARHMAVSPAARMREVDPAVPALTEPEECRHIQLLHLEGALYFGSSGELQEILDRALRAPGLEVLVLRVKRTHNLDVTAAEVLTRAAELARTRGQEIYLVGMRPRAMARLERMGVVEVFGEDQLFPTQSRWFGALDEAVAQALARVGPHEHDGPCPLARYLKRRQALRKWTPDE